MIENLVVGIVLSIATAAGTYLAKVIASFFKSKTKNERLRGIIDAINEIVIICVKSTAQTAKKQAKQELNGQSLSPELAKKIFSETFKEVKCLIPESIEDDVAKLLPNIDGYVKHKIESAILDLKNATTDRMENFVAGSVEEIDSLKL